MDDSALGAQVGSLSGSTPLSPQLAQLNPQSAKAAWVRNQRVDGSARTVSELAALLEKDVRFVNWREGNVRCSPSGEASFRIGDLAQWALAQAKTRDSAEVVYQLVEFVTNNSVRMTEVLVLWGLHPKTPVDLGNGLRLVSLESLPPSQPWDRFFGIRDVPLTEGDGFPVPRPRAALVHDFIHQPVRAPIGFQGPSPSVQLRLREVAGALPLATFSPVCEIAHWYQCEVTTPLIGGVLGWGGQAIEHVFHTAIEPRDYDAPDMAGTVSQFLGLDENVRRVLRIALSHLNRAMRTVDNPSRAIDLGIALEAFLTTDQTRDDSIAYRLRQRAAVLLGGSGPGKKTAYERVKKLYNLRSQAVHGTPLPLKTSWLGQSVSTGEFLQESASLITDLLRCVLKLGSIPDWDALIMGW